MSKYCSLLTILFKPYCDVTKISVVQLNIFYCIPVMAKLQFQNHYSSSLKCHTTLQKSF